MRSFVHVLYLHRTVLPHSLITVGVRYLDVNLRIGVSTNTNRL